MWKPRTKLITFEKLILAQVIKSYPPFIELMKVYYRVHKTNASLDIILSQLNPVSIISYTVSSVLILCSQRSLGLLINIGYSN
jgi:hypothetical protein